MLHGLPYQEDAIRICRSEKLSIGLKGYLSQLVRVHVVLTRFPPIRPPSAAIPQAKRCAAARLKQPIIQTSRGCASVSVASARNVSITQQVHGRKTSVTAPNHRQDSTSACSRKLTRGQPSNYIHPSRVTCCALYIFDKVQVPGWTQLVQLAEKGRR